MRCREIEVCWGVLIAIAICLLGPAARAGVFVNDREVVPATPIATDIISIVIDGYFHDSGHTIQGAPYVTVNGNSVSIEVDTLGCPLYLCFTIIVPFSITAVIGSLTSGSYEDTIRIYEDGLLVETLQGSFDVLSNICPSGDDDFDGICNDEDNCLDVPNPNQVDTNHDGYGNRCDADLNSDDAIGIVDFSRFRFSFGQQCGGPNYDEDADFNSDCSIGVPDFNVLRKYFGGVPGPSGHLCAGTIPCP